MVDLHADAARPSRQRPRTACSNNNIRAVKTGSVCVGGPLHAVMHVAYTTERKRSLPRRISAARKSLSFVVAINGVPAGLPEIFVLRGRRTGLHRQYRVHTYLF